MEDWDELDGPELLVFKINGSEIEAKQLSPWCPEQWLFFKNHKQVGYLRLRHGYLSIRYPDWSGDVLHETMAIMGDGCFYDYGERIRELKKAIVLIDEHLATIGE